MFHGNLYNEQNVNIWSEPLTDYNAVKQITKNLFNNLSLTDDWQAKLKIWLHHLSKIEWKSSVINFLKLDFIKVLKIKCKFLEDIPKSLLGSTKDFFDKVGKFQNPSQTIIIF